MCGFSEAEQKEIVAALRGVGDTGGVSSQDSVDALTAAVAVVDTNVDTTLVNLAVVDGNVDTTLTNLAVVDGYTEKIDGVAVDGLSGVENSLGYKIDEIEHHLHNEGQWWGRDAGGTELAVQNGLTTWQLTAGTGGAYGAWVQITDGTQFTTGARFDPHLLGITAVSAQDKSYLIQFGEGEGGAQTAFTTTWFYAPSNQVNAGPVAVISPRKANTIKLWMRIACETNGATLNTLLGTHPYSG